MKLQGENSAVSFGSRCCPLKTRVLVNPLVCLSLRMSHRHGASGPAEGQLRRHRETCQHSVKGCRGRCRGKPRAQGNKQISEGTRIHQEVSVSENARQKCKRKSLDSLQTEHQIIYPFHFRTVVEVQ